MSLKLKNYQYFLILLILNLISAVIGKHVLSNDTILTNYYSEQFGKEVAYKILSSKEKWEWVSYVIIPIIILLRTNLVMLSLYIGLFFAELEEKITYKKLFTVTLLGEFILVLVGYFKLFYFAFFKPNYTFEDLSSFYPFSLTNFLDVKTIEPWLVYPLQTINLFEISYFLVLVYGLHQILKNKYWKSFEIVALSYGTGLIIWVGLVMFLILNFT